MEAAMACSLLQLLVGLYAQLQLVDKSREAKGFSMGS